MVIVDSISKYGSDLAAVEAYFERLCPNWVDASGQRLDNLFVVMVAPSDREKNMFLGSYYSGAFDIPSTYSQLSNTYFRNRQWEMGIASELQGTTNLALNYRQRTLSAQRSLQQPTQRTFPAAGQPRAQKADSGTSIFAIFFFTFIILSIVGLTLYFIFRKSSPATTAATPTDYDGTYSASTPYRSYAAAAPSHTTVINNNSGDGFVTGMLVGEALSRPSQPSVVYVEPTPMLPGTGTEPTPSYDEPAKTDAPDSTWEDTTPQADTSFSEPDPAPDTSFSDSSSDSSFGGGDSGGGSSDSGF